MDLNAKHFYIQNKSLRLRKQGPAFVLFWQPKCNGCETFKPIFDKLNMKLNSEITFYRINVAMYRDVIKLSKETRTSITSVPTIMIFNDGILINDYKDSRAPDAVYQMILSTLNSLKMSSKKGFSRSSSSSSSSSFSESMPTSSYPGDDEIRSFSQRQGRRSINRRIGDYEDDLDGKEEEQEESDSILIEIPDLRPYNRPWGGGYRRG
jgi:thiol-disulfide isomerase/thioredoxin